MAQPVWVLSVDLQTKTATFSTGMADAARNARGAFTDIKQGGDEMGRAVSGSMMEARHGVMLLGEEFGVHLPRALTTFIASIGPIGAAMEAAFPFLAIIVGATLLLEHLAKVKEAGEQLTINQEKFGTAINNTFNALDEKLLQAQIRTDELNKDHLGALRKQLQLIDMQSMNELVHSFEAVAARADVTFKGLEVHMWNLGIGSAGAKHALADFKAEYESLISQHKNGAAGDLLAGTLRSAERVLAMQKQYKDNQTDATGKTNKNANDGKFAEASLALKQAGVGVTQQEVQSQEALVQALRAQVDVEGKVASLKAQQSGNATGAANKAITADSYKALKAQMDAERAVQEQEEKERDEARTRAIANLQDGERQKIEATEKGTAARLQAIDAGIKEENKYGLQETSFYRSLLNDRVNTVREMAQEEAKLKAEAGKEAAEHTQKMAEFELAATQEHARLLMSGRRVSEQEMLANEIQAANRDYEIKKTALDQEIAALDASGKDYQNKLKALQDKETEITKQHENQIAQIKDKAQIEQNQRIQSSIQQMENTVAGGLARSIMQQQSFASMMADIGNQVLSGALKSVLLMETVQGRKRLSDARTAASNAYEWGWENGGPAAPVLAPLLGAGAFTAAMAFAGGGIVPGVGRGDIVPAMLTPGEHVADKELTDGLRGMVKNGGAGGGHTTHLHYRPIYHVQTIDSDGINQTLKTHAQEFSKHFQNELRRMNR